ncbi:hypothetical protein [Bowmanella denitrificans]|uniref:hypothetical protein n=1 Tax=Bowmanella denitrificans TaxID=366582 RepID=UPI0011AF1315|nr:hypothetical protein [Bowmanella denitrificans]
MEQLPNTRTLLILAKAETGRSTQGNSHQIPILSLLLGFIAFSTCNLTDNPLPITLFKNTILRKRFARSTMLFTGDNQASSIPRKMVTKPSSLHQPENATKYGLYVSFCNLGIANTRSALSNTAKQV